MAYADYYSNRIQKILSDSRNLNSLPLDQRLAWVKQAKKELKLIKKEIQLEMKKTREIYRTEKANASAGWFSTLKENKARIRRNEDSAISPYQSQIHNAESALIDLESKELFLTKQKSQATWSTTSGSAQSTSNSIVGGVYLLKSGKYYKIEKAAVFDERIKRIELQQPEPVEIVHKIYALNRDELEKYWHNRFASRRKNGEWFELLPQDVTEFKNWSG